jgi:deoxyribodipyrimidine photo-lyase
MYGRQTEANALDHRRAHAEAAREASSRRSRVAGATLAEPALTEPKRTHVLREAEGPAPGPVVYWMQQARRERDNPALEHALALAMRWERPACVVYALDARGATERSLVFELQGLRELRDTLRGRGIGFACRVGPAASVALRAAAGAAALVCDRGYLREPRSCLERVAREAPCGVVEIEGEAIVPVAVASDKLEHAARTIRPKLWRHVERFVELPPRVEVAVRWDGDARVPGEGEDVSVELDHPLELARRLGCDARAGSAADWFEGGERTAAAALGRFLGGALERYAEGRRSLEHPAVSYLSMHLRHGQISPVRVLREVRRHADEAGVAAEPVDAFLEELVVRRELAINHAWYEADYDRYGALPEWARATLAAHAGDEREQVYDAETLEAGETHDRYWNAAMREMREAGYLHNHMRMYWGKRMLAWSKEPEAAFEVTRELNDRYFLDGRDPNTYANVAWIYGRHDRPWPERPVFGKVRSMVAAGLRRKADPEAYVERVERMLGARVAGPNEPE